MLINTPSSQGALGDIYNFHMDPSLTLGCGTWGSTSISQNLTVSHLLNIKTVAEKQENMLWLRIPPKIYFKTGCLEPALKEFSNKKRAFIITDQSLYELKMVHLVTNVLNEMGLEHQTFHHVKPDPDIDNAKMIVGEMNDYKPDLIIAFGGGSPMDAAKIAWLMYEQPDANFDRLSTTFMDIRKRIYNIKTLGAKSSLVCIPTSSGTGSEVSPFSVITDSKTGKKYPLADYNLTPNMAIIDAQFVMNMPKNLTANSGIDAITHAIESFVSVYATEFTFAYSLEALENLFKYLPSAYKNGRDDPDARMKVHNASTMAGIAFGNAFLGICHSLAHKLGSQFHVEHGKANAAFLPHVIAYNATDSPFKMATFPQYKYPQARERYVKIAKLLQLNGKSDDEHIWCLINAIEDMKATIEIPDSLEKIIGNEMKEVYFDSIPHMAEMAFDDQCTGANPRYPLITDLEKIFRDAWYGPPKRA
jgi:acetaldehyde dehydrogenase/alcohol dehydrogenase